MHQSFSAGLSYTDGTRHQIKYEFLSDGDGTGTVNYYKRDSDGDAWTQTGSSGDINSFRWPPKDVTTDIQVGSSPGNTTPRTFDGKIYRCRLWVGGDETTGTLEADMNGEDADGGTVGDTDTWTSATSGEVWTVHGSGLTTGTD